MEESSFIWILQGIITLLLGGNIFWLKKYVGKWDKRADEWEKQGGLVTRNDHFDWCADKQKTCPAFLGFQALSQWKEFLLSKGGTMTIADHIIICEKKMEKEIVMWQKDLNIVIGELRDLKEQLSDVKKDVKENNQEIIQIAKVQQRVLQKLEIKL